VRDKLLIYRIATAKYLECCKTACNLQSADHFSWDAKNEIAFYDSCISLTGSYLIRLLFLNSVMVMLLPGVVLLQVRNFTSYSVLEVKKNLMFLSDQLNWVPG
jgi:hypothetical protein